MKIFISHSVIDKDVAKKFKDLFVVFGKDLFKKCNNVFSPDDVFLSSDITRDQRKIDQWKQNFEVNLKDCSLFIVLVTPDSLHSRWVQYEMGFASALEKTILPIGIKGVSPEGFLLSNCTMQMVEEFEDIKKTLKLVFPKTKENSNSEKCETTYDDTINQNCETYKEIIDNLLELCKERCVYFVGSKPRKEKKWNQRFVNNFLNQVATKLLENGIKVSSFPSVEGVGKIVCEAAMKSNSRLYEISGLYNFDKLFEESSKLKEIDQNTWNEILKEFRRLYLKNKSSMVIIGGKKHTKDECEVAETFEHLEIFPIPCMGGYGETLFNMNIEKYRRTEHPCIECKGHDNNVCKQIDKFVERLGHFIYLNEEDERKS